MLLAYDKPNDMPLYERNILNAFDLYMTNKYERVHKVTSVVDV